MFGLVEQGKTIVAALGRIEALRRVGYLDDEAQSAAAPAVMPSAWLVMESCERDPEQQRASVTWAVVLKSKRLRGLDKDLPILAQVERVIETLHGLRAADGWTPLEFREANYMEPQAEGAAYYIRFAAATHHSRGLTRCPV